MCSSRTLTLHRETDDGEQAIRVVVRWQSEDRACGLRAQWVVDETETELTPDEECRVVEEAAESERDERLAAWDQADALRRECREWRV